MTLKGWVWSRQAFVVPAEAADALEPSAPEMIEEAFTLPADLAEAGGAVPSRPLNRLIRLNYPKSASASDPVTKEILVGSTIVGKERKGGNAAFDIELTGKHADRFTCTTP